MELGKLERQLKLIELLTDNTLYDINRIAEIIGISKRSVYRYVEMLQNVGFVISSSNGIFSIMPNSPFIKRIRGKIALSQMEIETVRSLISKADKENFAVKKLKERFESLYGTGIVSDIKINNQKAANTEILFKAISQKKIVVLHDYFSPHKNTLSDRIVEPFKFIHNNEEIRCLETESMTRKNFRIDRIMGKVEMTADKWKHSKLHFDYFTDIFGFSAEKKERVTLRMKPFAAQVLMEEFGVDKYMFVVEDENNWVIPLSVCSYLGVGRFVLGLIQYIEIIDNKNFKDYIKEILHSLTI